ncbi:phosphoribosylglycinamide formyltransferase [Spirochaeta cellobiosiphila]|uniref:phosphoribosylglycinamide formyltransferase n=1 Tax=Spirochaeta cellobiosiphila TaxID=504483 RepID=UPI000409B5A8|nr:phosphoribosylglycinamide formyltransferase [Spirochaeta cellobiosiphila]
MAKIAVMASGSGSNFEALVKGLHGTSHKVELLICDKQQAYALTRAEKLEIPSYVVLYRGRKREEAEEDILSILEKAQVDLVVLAGYMRLLSPTFVNPLKDKIINIHPSLLPKHPGTHGIEDSWKSDDSEMGITIHYVDQGMDTGPIIEQYSFVKEDKDTLDTVEKKIHSLEHKYYPEVIIRLLDKIDLEDK